MKDRYWCIVNLTAKNSRTITKVARPSLSLTIGPIYHSKDFSVPVFYLLTNKEIIEDTRGSSTKQDTNDGHCACSQCFQKPILFNQNALKDLVRNLDIPKLLPSCYQVNGAC